MKIKNERWHDQLFWRISNREALSFLKEIYPYLREKKSQAEYCFKNGWRVWESYHLKNLSKLKQDKGNDGGNYQNLERTKQLDLIIFEDSERI